MRKGDGEKEGGEMRRKGVGGEVGAKKEWERGRSRGIGGGGREKVKGEEEEAWGRRRGTGGLARKPYRVIPATGKAGTWVARHLFICFMNAFLATNLLQDFLTDQMLSRERSLKVIGVL